MEGSELKGPLNCGGCLNTIVDESYVSALDHNWHTDCFRCSVCDDPLSSWYFEKDGLLFCQTDYWVRYGESCQQCGQVITGPVMSAGDHRFHPECFACISCGANIEDGEPYALVERSKLYCDSCYDMNTRSAHAIRVLPVPGGALRLAPTSGDKFTVKEDSGRRCEGAMSAAVRGLLRAALALCIQLTCRRIDSSYGVLSVRIGDRVLEINGEPARSSLHHIDRLLARRDAVIQLTIEHDPDGMNNKRNQVCHSSVVDASKPSIKPKETEDSVQLNIPKRHSNEIKDNTKDKKELDSLSQPPLMVENVNRGPKVDEGEVVKKERLFKRKGDGQGKMRMIKRRQTPSSPLLGEKERSSSMSKLLDVVDGEEACGVLRDLSRARSFRAEPAAGQKVFRACDLQLGELLGSGFFGQVYRVTHRATGEVMVLKQLYRVDEDAQRNFLKEVAVLRSLQHPNVLRFVGVLYKDKRLHLVTEYVAGGTLQQLLQDASVPLCWATRARLARDIAAGVGYLHRMSIIHRDLNSHNCLVREDKTVIVADFGLARIVQRTASSSPERRSARHAPHRRKRYTVVGNPYWMAPEMMNGNLYDEKVDVFSFGIILCEIIGRVQADPDFLPRRSDFGLNEVQFLEQFCEGCPEPLYRLAFVACRLDPDARPPFEVMETWLENLVVDLSSPGFQRDGVLADILKYAQEQAAYAAECCKRENHVPKIRVDGSDGGVLCCPCQNCGSCGKTHNRSNEATNLPTPVADGVVKSKSNVAMPVQCLLMDEVTSGRALGKCVSASHICQAQRPIVTVTKLSRSQNALANAPAGFILRAHGKNINITRVDDITQYLDPPPPLKCTGPDTHIDRIEADHVQKSRKVDGKNNVEENLPPFLRNQSVEGLETESKHEVEPPLPFCRHFSIPDNCEDAGDDTDSSDDEADMCNWYRNVSSFKKLEKMDVDQPKNILAGIVKKGENLLAKKSSYDVTDVTQLQDCKDKKADEDKQRYIQNSAKIRSDSKVPEQQLVKQEKANFFAKKLLSPKLSRLFKPNTTEVIRNKSEPEENKEEKSRSKFFIQRPSSPSSICRPAHRIRPLEDRRNVTEQRSIHGTNVLKSDLKLASMGKPMTPIFRRHVQDRADFGEGRFSYRDRRNPNMELKAAAEPKFVDLGRNRIKTPVSSPLVRCSQSNVPALATVLEKNKTTSKDVDRAEVDGKSIKTAISRSNYVSLANLKINSKKEQLEKPAEREEKNRALSAERVL